MICQIKPIRYWYIIRADLVYRRMSEEFLIFEPILKRIMNFEIRISCCLFQNDISLRKKAVIIAASQNEYCCMDLHRYNFFMRTE